MFDEFFSDAPVKSTEKDRIQGLMKEFPEFVEDTVWLDSLIKEGSTWQLKPVQKLALQTLRDTGCLIGGLGVGSGKTLIAWLAIRVLRAKNAIIFVPASLKAHFYTEISKYRKHFKGPRSINFTVMSYSELSKKNGSTILGKIKPDLIVMDEAHRLRNETAARTKRFLRHVIEHPIPIIPMSGTLFNKSIRDVSHFFKYGMKEYSPLPVFSDGDLDAWANVLDYDTDPAPRSLLEFDYILKHYGYNVDKDSKWQEQQKVARKAFYELLDNTKGFVLSDTMSCNASILLDSYENSLHTDVKTAIRTVLEEGTTPDGEHYFETPAHAALCVKQLITGFYYSYDWDAIGGYDDEWVMARKCWNKTVRKELEDSKEGYDSPGLIKDKIESDYYKGIRKTKHLHYEAWLGQRDKPTPPRKVTWVSTQFIDNLIPKLDNKVPRLVWYHFNETGDMLRTKGLEVYKSGDILPLEELSKKPRTLAVSIKAFGEGVNLQSYHNNFVIEPPTSNSVWEQLIGRTHRQGQLADEITVVINQSYRALKTAVKKSIDQAHYVTQTTGQPQRLTVADWKQK